jgi:hypothetical protein
VNRLYRSVGILEFDGGDYNFSYLRSAIGAEWFRPLPGLSKIESAYRSTDLFPLFRERIISPRRSDYDQTMEALGLRLGAEPFEVLSRSGGHRAGDTIELIPIPHPARDGTVRITFFAHGVRYLTAETQASIADLRVGEPLRLQSDESNTVNPRALLVMRTDAARLGYVPDPLVSFVHEVIANPYSLQVERSNGPEVAFHYRLLIRLEGQAAPGSALFNGESMETVA